MSSIRWWVGPVDNPDAPQRPQGTLPSFVQLVPEGQTLRNMLLSEEVDALMVPTPPDGFSERNSPKVRIIDDYKRAEQAYYRRTHLYPPHHIIGMRRKVFDRNPWIVRILYDALERSRLIWQERRRAWAEFSPWLLTEIEDVTALIGHDWQPNGYQANQTAIQAFCDELLAQGLIAQTIDGANVFAEFQQVMNG
ncbi:MAG: hypothetical protein MUO76_10950 [Anaerolineaceae bacterium]|nr:hypothetical protein [Anaerolineaceae bacterium]